MARDAEIWEPFTPPTGGDPQCGTLIGGVHFTLFYDYDELRDGKLWSAATTDDARIEWLRRRIAGVLIEPLARLLDPSSAAFVEVNSEFKKTTAQGAHMQGAWRTFTGSAFLVALTAIDALGQFVPPPAKPNPPLWQHSGARFRNFIAVLMPQWDVTIPYQGQQMQSDCSQVLAKSQGKLSSILWTEFRCGYAHVFRSHGVGYDIFLNGRWGIVDGILEVNPVAFFQDFRGAVSQLFHLTQSDAGFRQFFIKAFAEVDPARR